MKNPYVFTSNNITYRLEESAFSVRDAHLYIIDESGNVIEEVLDNEKKYWLMAIARSEMFANITKSSKQK